MKMADTIRVSPLNNKAADCQYSMHFIPCKIAHSGGAKVKEYFENSVRNSDEACFNGEQEVKTASFRGRPLKGRTIGLPPNCKGLVLKEEQQPCLDEEERTFVPKASFESFCYWNLDSKPTDNDTICKAFQWIEIANVLHGNTEKMEGEEQLEPTQTDR